MPPNGIELLPLLPPRPAAIASPITPSSMNLSPLPHGSAASRGPGPASRHFAGTGDNAAAEFDPDLGGGQTPDRRRGCPNAGAATTPGAAGQPGDPPDVRLSLDPQIQSKSDPDATSNPNPIIDVKSNLSKAKLHLLRDGSRLVSTRITASRGLPSFRQPGPSRPPHLRGSTGHCPPLPLEVARRDFTVLETTSTAQQGVTRGQRRHWRRDH